MHIRLTCPHITCPSITCLHIAYARLALTQYVLRHVWAHQPPAKAVLRECNVRHVRQHRSGEGRGTWGRMQHHTDATRLVVKPRVRDFGWGGGGVVGQTTGGHCGFAAIDDSMATLG